MFEQAIKNESVDLQALIMFLVFEKEVLSMEDDTRELDRYFLEKHNQRMNKELHAYKQKMNMKYDPTLYEIKHGTMISFILAYSVKQARFIAYENMIDIDEIEPVTNLEFLMFYEGRDTKFKNIIKAKKPCYLGGFDYRNYKTCIRANESFRGS